MKNNINPDHYKNQTSLECIEAMEIAFGREVVLHFCLCNAFKYIWRWKNKNGEEDLEKASWYINKGMSLISNRETSPSPQIKKYLINFVEMNLYVLRQKSNKGEVNGVDRNS